MLLPCARHMMLGAGVDDSLAVSNELQIFKPLASTCMRLHRWMAGFSLSSCTWALVFVFCAPNASWLWICADSAEGSTADTSFGGLPEEGATVGRLTDQGRNSGEAIGGLADWRIGCAGHVGQVGQAGPVAQGSAVSLHFRNRPGAASGCSSGVSSFQPPPPTLAVCTCQLACRFSDPCHLQLTTVRRRSAAAAGTLQVRIWERNFRLRLRTTNAAYICRLETYKYIL